MNIRKAENKKSKEMAFITAPDTEFAIFPKLFNNFYIVGKQTIPSAASSMLSREFCLSYTDKIIKF